MASAHCWTLSLSQVTAALQPARGQGLSELSTFPGLWVNIGDCAGKALSSLDVRLTVFHRTAKIWDMISSYTTCPSLVCFWTSCFLNGGGRDQCFPVMRSLHLFLEVPLLLYLKDIKGMVFCLTDSFGPALEAQTGNMALHGVWCPPYSTPLCGNRTPAVATSYVQPISFCL